MKTENSWKKQDPGKFPTRKAKNRLFFPCHLENFPYTPLFRVILNLTAEDAEGRRDRKHKAKNNLDRIYMINRIFFKPHPVDPVDPVKNNYFLWIDTTRNPKHETRNCSGGAP
jgi:hypothetical protein